MTSGALLTRQVTSRHGTLKAFQIREGRSVDPRTIVKIYNSVTGPLDEGVRVNEPNIVMRLARDRRSVYVGFLDGEPVSIINVVRRVDTSVPDTHQRLTDDDTFDSTLEDGALSWFCPWVAVLQHARGFNFTDDRRRMSLGQLHIWQVREDALVDPYVEQLFAYSRPTNIRPFIENSGKLAETDDVGLERPTFFLDGYRLCLAREGVMFAETGVKVLDMASYWEEKHPAIPNRQYDDVFHFHGSMGAIFRPDLVKPYGHVNDRLSLCYRTPLEYRLEK